MQELIPVITRVKRVVPSCRRQERCRIRKGRGGGSPERELSSPVMRDLLAWEPSRSSPAVARQRGQHHGSSLSFDLWVRKIVTSSCQAFVVMVQAAHLGDRDDLACAWTLHRLRTRGASGITTVGRV